MYIILSIRSFRSIVKYLKIDRFERKFCFLPTFVKTLRIDANLFINRARNISTVIFIASAKKARRDQKGC